MKTTQRLTDAFSARTFSRKETRAILIDIADGAQTARFTDYSGGAQAVMAIDTLLNAMAASGQIGPDALKGLKIDISRAYRAVGDAKSYRPAEFKEALLRIGSKVRAL